VRKDEVLYLLQEDERMFYPYGDERLLCTETLAERGLSVVVNTGRLLTHLRRDYPDLHAFSFEPAFPGVTQEPPAPEGKRRFFFYSRPENARNLFWRGASVLAEAVTTNVLPPEEWAFYFVGRATPDLSLGRGVRPILVEGLPWSDYQALVAGMDAALVLMDTPHPSYPPLDLAAAGAAVLTNRHPGKEDLSDLSRNILSADLALPALLEGLREVARLGVDDEERARRRAADGLSRSWVDSLGSVAANLPPAVASRLGARSHVR
jgi:hypothetical protein